MGFPSLSFEALVCAFRRYPLFMMQMPLPNQMSLEDPVLRREATLINSSHGPSLSVRYNGQLAAGVSMSLSLLLQLLEADLRIMWRLMLEVVA